MVNLRAALDLGADDRAELSCVGSIVGATPIEMLRLRVVRSRRAIDDAAGIDPVDMQCLHSSLFFSSRASGSSGNQ